MRRLMPGRVVLEARGVRQWIGGAGLLGRRRRAARAIVDGVDLSIVAGQVVALVGESGAGKSSLARILVGLQPPDGGQVLLQGEDLYRLSGRARQAARLKVQMVYQDPYDCLPPRMSVQRIVEEPLLAHRLEPDRATRLQRVCAALESVELSPAAEFLRRRPPELSGGQRQRVALASALVVEPLALVADEPVAMLDLSLRAGILALLKDLSRQRDLGVLLITHDLATIAHFSERLAVLYQGRVVEAGATRAALDQPFHPYLRDLLEAVTALDRPAPDWGPPPAAAGASAGCPYRPRCRFAQSRCADVEPALRPVGPDRLAACILELNREPA